MGERKVQHPQKDQVNPKKGKPSDPTGWRRSDKAEIDGRQETWAVRSGSWQTRIPQNYKRREDSSENLVQGERGPSSLERILKPLQREPERITGPHCRQSLHCSRSQKMKSLGVSRRRCRPRTGESDGRTAACPRNLEERCRRRRRRTGEDKLRRGHAIRDT